jgi:hypothetical protein
MVENNNPTTHQHIKMPIATDMMDKTTPPHFSEIFNTIATIIGMIWMIKVFITTTTRLFDGSYFYICLSSTPTGIYNNINRIVDILRNNINKTIDLLEKDDLLKEFCNFEEIRSIANYEIQCVNSMIYRSCIAPQFPYIMCGFDMSDEISRISNLICHVINIQLVTKKCNFRYTYLQNNKNCADFCVMLVEKYVCMCTKTQKEFKIYSLESMRTNNKKYFIELDNYYHKICASYPGMDVELIATSIITGKIEKYVTVCNIPIHTLLFALDSELSSNE